MGQNWVRIAIEAEDELNGAREHGSVMAATDALAARLGTTRQALRNYATALRFVRNVEASDPEAGKALARLSAAMVAVYARWARYDRPGALAHARIAGTSHLPASEIITAEAAAREKYDTPATSALEQALEIAAAKAEPDPAGGVVAWALQRAGVRPVGLNWFEVAATDLSLAATAGVREVLVLRLVVGSASSSPLQDDRYFRNRGQADQLEIAGALQVAQTDIRGGYRRIAKPTFVRAVAAACLYPIVLIVLPDRDALSEFEVALPELPADRLGVGNEKAPPGALLPGPGLGCIIVVSADQITHLWNGTVPTSKAETALQKVGRNKRKNQ